MQRQLDGCRETDADGQATGSRPASCKMIKFWKRPIIARKTAAAGSHLQANTSALAAPMKPKKGATVSPDWLAACSSARSMMPRCERRAAPPVWPPTRSAVTHRCRATLAATHRCRATLLCGPLWRGGHRPCATAADSTDLILLVRGGEFATGGSVTRVRRAVPRQPETTDAWSHWGGRAGQLVACYQSGRASADCSRERLQTLFLCTAVASALQRPVLPPSHQCCLSVTGWTSTRHPQGSTRPAETTGQRRSAVFGGTAPQPHILLSAQGVTAVRSAAGSVGVCSFLFGILRHPTPPANHSRPFSGPAPASCDGTR